MQATLVTPPPKHAARYEQATPLCTVRKLHQKSDIMLKIHVLCNRLYLTVTPAKLSSEPRVNVYSCSEQMDSGCSEDESIPRLWANASSESLLHIYYDHRAIPCSQPASRRSTQLRLVKLERERERQRQSPFSI